MKQNIVGREYECERLDDCMLSNQAQLIIIYGRRRIGKTFLINEYFDHHFAFKITGAYNQSRKVQLHSFAAELTRKTGIKWKDPENWIQAFEDLRAYLEKSEPMEKQVVFFDEMPWLDSHKSYFLPAFEWFWNDWGSTRNNLVFIVCGSASSWLDEKFSENRGGLFNRQTCRLYLQPFTLHETELFLQSKNIFWSRYEIAECYMIMGGIPFYLNALSERYSLTQNIDRLFFQPKGEFWDEFDHLYKTLFSNSRLHLQIAEALSAKPGGLSRQEICQCCKISDNGALTKALHNLNSSGFIQAARFYGKKAKDTRYRLSDHYSVFYFRFVRDFYGKDAHFWSNSIDLPTRRSWSGLAFESLCMEHIPQIKRKLGILGVLSEESVWRTRGNEETGTRGAQIDLLIDRRDRVINLCEIKFSIGEFTIDQAYDLALRNKISVFRQETKSRKSLQLIMITTYGLKRNMYSGLVQNQVTLDDLFQP